MANIFKQKFGISIGLVVKDRMGLFMENGINYMEFRFDKTPDLEFGRNFVKEVKAEKEKYLGAKIVCDEVKKLKAQNFIKWDEIERQYETLKQVNA